MPDVLDDELRHVDGELALDDERRGASPDGVGGKLVPVHAAAGDAEEECSGCDVARVVGEVGDLDLVAAQNARRRDRGEPPEFHRRPTLDD